MELMRTKREERMSKILFLLRQLGESEKTTFLKYLFVLGMLERRELKEPSPENVQKERRKAQ